MLLFRGGQAVHIMSESLKIPDGYYGLQIHQDYPSVQGSKNGCVVWIALTDIDENSYPLEVISKSHKNGLYSLFHNKDKRYEINSSEYDEKDLTPITCSAGDVIFMSYFTLHKSSLRGDERVRLACSTRYDDANDQQFISDTYPSGYKRTVDREMCESLTIKDKK